MSNEPTIRSFLGPPKLKNKIIAPEERHGI
jgi:hypothetical protein